MASTNQPNLKLTDTQLVLLSAASQRDDGLLIPPASIKGPALAAALKALLRCGLVAAVGGERDRPGWPTDERGRPVEARITRAGLAALGITPEADEEALPTRAAKRRAARKPNGAGPAPAGGERSPAPIQAEPATAQAAARSGTKQALVIGLLSREHGAALDDLIAATGWLPHTTRAALTGLRRKGYALERSKDADGRTTYRIAGRPEAAAIAQAAA